MCGLLHLYSFFSIPADSLNDVSLRFLVIQVDKDENIDKDVVEAAGLYVRLKLF